jgi:hypothetical protein
VNEREALARQLYGESSHKHVLHALEGLDPELAGRRAGRSPHTIYQILQHMTYWQDIAEARLRGEPPPRPSSAALGWTERERPRTRATGRRRSRASPRACARSRRACSIPSSISAAWSSAIAA